jgi:predicted dehydrogenase
MVSVGIGLVGVGKHGSRYAHHIVTDLPGARLVAIARRDSSAARQQAVAFGCRAYGDYRELCADPEVEAVVVVVPPSLHPEIVEAAAAFRRPVLLEKPAATSVADGRRILLAAQRAGIATMVAQTLRYNEVVRTVRSACGQIGRIHALRISQRFEPSRPAWIDDPRVAGGGIILHTGVHSFDLVRLLSGLEAEHVSCEVSRVRTTATEDNFSAVIRLSDGVGLAAVSGSRATASRSGPIEVAGEGGQIVADHVLSSAAIVRGNTLTALPVPPRVATVREVLQDFVGALRGGTSMPIPLTEGVRAVAIAEACYRAAASARSEPVAAVE